jgi:hypothetical protein
MEHRIAFPRKVCPARRWRSRRKRHAGPTAGRINKMGTSAASVCRWLRVPVQLRAGGAELMAGGAKGHVSPPREVVGGCPAISLLRQAEKHDKQAKTVRSEACLCQVTMNATCCSTLDRWPSINRGCKVRPGCRGIATQQPAARPRNGSEQGTRALRHVSRTHTLPPPVRPAEPHPPAGANRGSSRTFATSPEPRRDGEFLTKVSNSKSQLSSQKSR